VRGIGTPPVEQLLPNDQVSTQPGQHQLGNLGVTMRYLGDPNQAKAYFEEAIMIYENVYDENHPSVARNVNNLALVLIDMGDFSGARSTLERALRIDLVSFGPNHWLVGLRLYNIGNLLFKIGDLVCASMYAAVAYLILKQTLGAEHPHVWRALGLLTELAMKNASEVAKTLFVAMIIGWQGL